MRILGITNRYPRLGHDWVATYNREQLRALARNHDVRMIVPVPWTDLVADIVTLNAAPAKYRNSDGIWVEHPWFYYPPRILRHRYGQMYLASVRKMVRRAIQEFHPDAILSCWAHPDGWAAVKLGREAGIPVMIKIIGSDILVLQRDSRRAWAIQEGLLGAASIIVVSQDLKNHVVAMGVSENKVHVVPEGLDKSIFCPGSRAEARERLGLQLDSRIVLFVGNIVLSKGVGVLVEACRAMRLTGCAFDCYIVGSGSNSRDIQNLIDQFGLSDRVKLIGSFPPFALSDWYRASNLVVLPSFSEGVPNVLREAIACGRPYVATSVGGIPEISKPDYSCLVPPRDAKALAAAIADMLDNDVQVAPAVSSNHSIDWEASANLVADRLTEMLPETFTKRPRARMAAIPMPTMATDRRRVLVITNRFSRPGHPDIATYNQAQLAALSRLYDVKIIAPVPWTQRLGDAIRMNIGPRRYRNSAGIDVEHPTYYFPPRILDQHWGFFYKASISRSVRNAVRKFKPHAVLACRAHPDGWAAVRLARILGLPVVVKVHGSDLLVATKNARRRASIADALRNADAVIAVSRHLAQQVQILGVDRRKIHVVYNGIDGTLFRPGSRTAARAHLGLRQDVRVLLFVGNMLYSKGIGVLAEACEILLNRGIQFHCYYVGEGADRGQLESEIAFRELRSRMTLVGGIKHCDLPPWYRAADLVVLPSFSEGIPNVLREAAACGIPFVASRVGGILEIADSSFSRLVSPGNAEEFANAIEASCAGPFPSPCANQEDSSLTWDESACHLAEKLGAVVDTCTAAECGEQERQRPATQAAIQGMTWPAIADLSRRYFH